ncbi:MAG: hypothetical protein C4324_11800 [Blastocatellia bacterium]
MTREYFGRDLEAMSFAGRYHRWVFELMQPWLGKRIVEVGAGQGSFAEILLGAAPEALALIEPSQMYERLVANKNLRRFDGQIELLNQTFPSVASELKRDFRPDSIVYVNVLEHIEDDLTELKCVADTLPDSGRIFLFVPAIPLLYSRFDRRLGHYRRYTRSELLGKMQLAGFEVEEIRWFDSVGILPWLINYRLLGLEKMNATAVAAYDRLLVPALKRIEDAIRAPIGKNLFAVGIRRT